MKFSVVQGHNAGRDKVVSVNELINWYPEFNEPGKAKHPSALMPTPGFDRIDTAPGLGIYTNCRAMHVAPTKTLSDRMFFVMGQELIEMDGAETFTSRGYLNTTTGTCQMASNGSQVLIVDGPNGYIFDMSTNSLSSITDPDFPNYTDLCECINGYFLVAVANYGGKFQFSYSYDGTNWDALDYMTAEHSMDDIMGFAKTSNGVLWLFGKQSVELWQGAQDANAPFVRIGGTVKPYGAIAKHSIATNGEYVLWLGGPTENAVYMGHGYDIKKVSTPKIEYAIGLHQTNHFYANAFCYEEEGHIFYVLSTNEITNAYDVTTGEWHRRTLGTGDPIGGLDDFASYACFRGYHYISRPDSYYIYKMSLDYPDDNGTEFLRTVITKPIEDENRLLRHKYIEISCSKDVADDTDITVYASNDGGHTFPTTLTLPVGKPTGAGHGQYETRARIHQLGASRNRVYKILDNSGERIVINSLHGLVV